MQFIAQRQLGRDNDICHPAIRDFVRKSRQLQTLYANLEGTYARRILCHDNTESLTVFLKGSISNNQWGDTNYEIDMNEVAEKLSKKIVSLRTTYSVKHEVHLAIIWVHLFNYSKNQMESTPLIKVFISNEEVQFIDTDAHVYHKWNEFLDSHYLPRALLCVPQDGVYENIKEHLRLNYFSTLLNKRKKCSLTMCQPYSEGISLFMDNLDNLLPCIRKCRINIIGAFHFIWNYLKENLVPLVVLVLKLAFNQFVKIESELSSLANYNTVMNDVMILGNDIVRVCMPKNSNMSVCPYDSFFQSVIDFFRVLSAYFWQTDNISFEDVIKSLLTLLYFARPLIMCILHIIAPENIMVHNLVNFLYSIYEEKEVLVKKGIKEDNPSNNALSLDDTQKLSSIQVESQSEGIYNAKVFAKKQPLYSVNKHPIQLSASQESSIKQVIEALPLLREEMNPKGLIDAVRNAAETLVIHKGPEEYSYLGKSENHDHIYLLKNITSIATLIGKQYQLNSRNKNSYNVVNIYGTKVGLILVITNNIILAVFLNNAIIHHTTECCCDI